MHHKTAAKPHHGAAAPDTEGATIRWWAPAYDAIVWLTTFGQEKNIRLATLKAAALQPGERVLDVGSGTGTLALGAWRKVRPEGEVTGIDASPEMVEVARRKATKNGSGATFQVAPIEDLPFGDGSLDVVLSSFMLHHLPDDVKDKGFAEIQRVLRPGGRFVAVDLAGGNRSLISRVIGLIGHSMPADYGDRLLDGMRRAGFSEAVETKSRFSYLHFLKATKAA